MFPLQIPKHLLDLLSPCFHSALEEQRADRNISMYFCWLSFLLLYFYFVLLLFLLSRLTEWVEKAAKKARKQRRAMVINIYSRSMCAGLCCFFVSRELKFNQGTHASLQLAGIQWEPVWHPCDDSLSPSFCT